MDCHDYQEHRRDGEKSGGERPERQLLTGFAVSPGNFALTCVSKSG